MSAAPGQREPHDSRKRAYRGRILSPRSGFFSDPACFDDWPDGLVEVSGEGKIERVGPYAPGLFEGPVLDVRPSVIVPGFVDAHLHYPQTRVVGSAKYELLPWLNNAVFPEEARFGDEAYAREVAREFIAKMLRFGTTACAAYSSSNARATEVLFEAFADAGMRAWVGLTLMDQEAPSDLLVPCDEAIEACERLSAAWHGYDGGRLSFVVTPRFAPSCSKALLERAGALAKERGLPIQTHISENVSECSFALSLHPYANDYLDIYDRAGLIGEKTLLAHSIYLSPSEWDRIAARGARIVHCPDSNFFLGSGRMPLWEARKRGIVVALGTDVAAGRSFDLRRTMTHAYDNGLCAGHVLSPAEIFAMATLGGAEALGMAKAIGSLEAGKEADFVVMRVSPHGKTAEQVLSEIVFAGDETQVQRAYVRGRLVYSLTV